MPFINHIFGLQSCTSGCVLDLNETFLKNFSVFFCGFEASTELWKFFLRVSPGQLSEKEQRDSSRIAWERSWCRRTLRTSPQKMYGANTHPKNHFLDDFINSVDSAHTVPAHTLLFRSARSWRCRWCVTYGSLRSTLIMRWSSSWGRWTDPQRFLSMFTWWEWCHPHILIIHFSYVEPSVIF